MTAKPDPVAPAAARSPQRPNDWIDLRSDTVTRPTPEMRRAMAEAEVGDDVYGEDPTVNRLEAKAAALFEREAALFVPSGSMGNLLCIRIHCDHGHEVICDARSHIMNFELASMSAIAGCIPRAVATPDGHLTWKQVEAALRPKTYYYAQTRLVALENTHNLAGGTLLPLESQEEICERAHERGLVVHLDGARIFNAAVARARSVAEMTRHVDSVMFCLSKGLGAPVGSLVLGSKAFIEKARVYRKMFGGGMRQAGVLAAAGLVAMQETPSRLSDDHRRARRLAEALTALPGVRIHHKIETNILVVDVASTGRSAFEIAEQLKQRGVLVGPFDASTIRLVTHFDVNDDALEAALRAWREVLTSAKSG